MTAPTKYPPTITPEEVTAYKRFSKEVAKAEKNLYGKTALQDKTLKELLGPDTKIDWAQTFEWALSIKNMFDREGTEAFLTKVAPDLVQKLFVIEGKTKTFLTLARALFVGLGYGSVPSPHPLSINLTVPPPPATQAQLGVVAPPASSVDYVNQPAPEG